MGEVYQAHDTKLGRDVAIKVLPEAFAHDTERLTRFQREAKMLASLNHPNIATIYGLEQTNGTHYLVMELVSGETLADRVKREGAVPIEEALKIGIQIAEALEAAHEKGIIHRDLKPANVKVTPEGKVKVLDFGLAKAFAGDGASSNPSDSPTLSAAATMQGMILGTAAYMSPEQARGKSVDKRTDIWAFGCVLYELLTGKQAFQGETTTEILAAVLRGEPDWQAVPPAVPANVRDLLRRCLQKDKALRLRDAGDARIEIQEAATSPSATGQENVVARKLGRWQLPLSVGLAAVIAAAVTGLAVWNLRPMPLPQRPVTRFTITLPAGQRLADLENPAIALSPDGTRLVYVATQGGGIQQLYLRPMDSPDAKPIPGTEGGATPFFSPDSQWVGFFADGKLKKVSAGGGAAVTLADARGNFRSGSWGTDDTIVFWFAGGSSIFRVSAGGGTLQPLITPKPGEAGVLSPEILPGAKAVLFMAGATLEDSKVAIRSQQTGERRDLTRGTRPGYALSGHLIYAQGGTLMAVPFDLQRQRLTGSPVPVLEGVLQNGGIPQYSFSSTGSMAYVAASSVQGIQRTLIWVDRKGAEQALPAPSRGYRTPRLSPDGRRVAVATTEDQIWLYDLARETLTRLTFGGLDFTPIWTPDGKRVAFQSTRGGARNSGVFWQLADGSGAAERLTTSEYGNNPGSFSPDGKVLVFVEVHPTTGRDLWTLNMSGDGKPQPFLRTSFNEGDARFSPDGRWLTYISDESGRNEIYVQPYPGPGGKWQISTDGGTEPVWARNGGIFYRNSKKMMAVDTMTQPTFSAGKPKVLFEGAYVPSLQTTPNYDVSADGQRFLMIKESEQSSSTTQINVVLNWFEELKRKVPPGK
jgi:Tol biopolymer transport system component